MTREERLKDLAAKYYTLVQNEKELKVSKDNIRTDLLKLAKESFKGKDHLLPVKTVEVPNDFFIKTGLSRQEFVDSRFPGWLIEHCEHNTATENTVFVFRRNPDFVNRIIETDDGVILSKTIAEYQPEIDWQDLKKGEPELHRELVKTEVIHVLNEEAFQRLAQERPGELATVQRYMKVKEPSIKLTAKRVVKDE